jgi:uncharacterized RDD family membrane protein YckC
MISALAAARSQVPASIWRRLAAYFIDACVLFVGGTFVAIPLAVALLTVCAAAGCGGTARDGVLGSAWAALVAVPIGYMFFSWWRPGRGRTIGMRAVGIRIVDVRGSEPGFGHALLRTLMWVAFATPTLSLLSALPPLVVLPMGQLQIGGFLLLVGCMLVRRDRRGLHDLVAGTTVVKGQ